MARDVRRRARASCAWGLARVLEVKKEAAAAVGVGMPAAAVREEAGIMMMPPVVV